MNHIKALSYFSDKRATQTASNRIERSADLGSVSQAFLSIERLETARAQLKKSLGQKLLSDLQQSSMSKNQLLLLEAAALVQGFVDRIGLQFIAIEELCGLSHSKTFRVTGRTQTSEQSFILKVVEYGPDAAHCVADPLVCRVAAVHYCTTAP